VGSKLVAEAAVLYANPNVPIRIALLDWSLVSGSMVVCGRGVCSENGEMLRGERSVTDISSRSFKLSLGGNDRLSFSSHLFFWSL
jgi:hypothetical protein